MSDSKVWVNLKEVCDIAELKPDQMVWCIGSDEDFLTEAHSIKETIGSFDWNDIQFALVSSGNEKDEDEKVIAEENPDKTVEPSADGFQISKRRTRQAVKIFKGADSEILEEKINEFLDTLSEVVNIKYSTSVASRGNVDVMMYSVLIHYLKED